MTDPGQSRNSDAGSGFEALELAEQNGPPEPEPTKKVFRYNALIEVSLICDAETEEDARKLGEELAAMVVDELSSNDERGVDVVACASLFEGPNDPDITYPALSVENEDGDLEYIPEKET